MSLAVVGLSHATAPIAVRERFVFSRQQGRSTLQRLIESGSAAETVLLSTCNRTEIYFRIEGQRSEEGGRERERAQNGVFEQGFGTQLEPIVSVLAEQAGMSAEEANAYLFSYRGPEVVRHLFSVACSLDSMVLGEAQIQGQVRTAYEEALAVASPPIVGPVLRRLFQAALTIGGKVRDETELGMGAASVPSAAVELAKKIFGPLKGRCALVLGAGEMSELALECLMGAGVRNAVVASRPEPETERRAQALAERVGARALPFDQLEHVLADTDIVAAATAAPHLVITRDLIGRAVPGGRRRPLLIVDIAVPRDVETAVGTLSNVFLYDIDDLRQIVDANLERRQAEIPAAEKIVTEGVEDFWSWYAGLEIVPVIRALRGRAEAVRQVEVARALRKLDHLRPEDREAVETLTRQLMNKVLHGPTVRLRAAAANGRGPSAVEAARYLFDLDSIDENE